MMEFFQRLVELFWKIFGITVMLLREFSGFYDDLSKKKRVSLKNMKWLLRLVFLKHEYASSS